MNSDDPVSLVAPPVFVCGNFNPRTLCQCATGAQPRHGHRAGALRSQQNGRLDPNELAALEADRARGAATNGFELIERSQEVVELTPFEVVEANNGYYASHHVGHSPQCENRDLASSISVVTKQQMSDFAMLDLNDIFNYEASTEGRATSRRSASTATAWCPTRPWTTRRRRIAFAG
jgi:hypothetical protein